MRKHYITLCVHNNTEVTYMVNSEGEIEVTFEQARTKGFNCLVTKINGDLISNDGFDDSEIDYFIRFLSRNRELIAEGTLESAYNIRTLWLSNQYLE